MQLPSNFGNSKSARALALVTGAAHRLGKAFALRLASQGYAIALHYHSSEEPARVAVDEIRALGVPVFQIQADLKDENEIHNLFAGIDAVISNQRDENLTLKVLVNSAAVMYHADARTMTVKEFDETVSLNLRAPFLCAQQAYQRMGPGSLIINISDIAAWKAWSGFPAYTVSKAGLEALTKVLARSFAPKVRVNAIAPGLVLRTENMPAAEWERLVQRLPAKRPASLEELSSTLEFLLKNEYITGQTITVDGGYSLI
ncbi:MAG TPA: SDR family oxidoreductase [Anaerolineales bacterium]|jgi:NAD(P)-dependent dehydrogenase (short-subunit alcohol dehydrogenase family)